MEAQTILRLVTYVTAGLIFTVGIVMLTGFTLPPHIPTSFRIITGIMMILYSTYRIVMVTIKKRNAQKE